MAEMGFPPDFGFSESRHRSGTLSRRIERKRKKWGKTLERRNIGSLKLLKGGRPGVDAIKRILTVGVTFELSKV